MVSIVFQMYRRLGSVLVCNTSKILVFFIALFLFSATGYMYFELPNNPDLSWLDAFWWSIVTMTTVGYGDLFPSSTPGRFLIGFPTMLLGIGILGYGLSVVATFMIESKMKEVRGMKDFIRSGHIIICHFADLDKTRNLIDELRRDSSTKNTKVVLIDDTLEELPKELQSDALHFVKGDPSRESTLKQANVEGARAAVIQAVLSDSDYSDDINLRICLTIESLSPDTFTIVECIQPRNIPFFKRANCDSVVSIASLAGQMLIQELQDPGVGTIVSELTSNQHGKQFYVVSVPAGMGTFEALKAHYETGQAIVLGIRREEQNHILPEAAFALEPDDQAILISSGRPA